MLAQKSPADTRTGSLVDELGVWQKFTGFSTSRIRIHIGELHTRFTTAARTRLDQAATEHDNTAGEQAADQYDLAERCLTAEIATALTWSNLRARDQLDIALILTTDLTATLHAVTHGHLDRAAPTRPDPQNHPHRRPRHQSRPAPSRTPPARPRPNPRRRPRRHRSEHRTHPEPPHD